MRPTAWCRATPKFSGLAWTCPNRKVRKQSRRADRDRAQRSFDVLYLFAKFFDFGADLEGQTGDGQGLGFYAGSFGQHGVGFAMHFLEQEIELLAEFACAVEKFCKLLEMTSQPVELFADVAAFSEQSGLLSQPGGLNAAAIE